MTQSSTVHAAASTRLEFATPEWFAMFGEVLRELASRHSGDSETISFSEVYQHVPRDIAGHDGAVGWAVEVDCGHVTYAPEPDPTADIVIACDYAFARDMLQEYDSTDEVAHRERKAVYRAAAAGGKFDVRGDLRRSPAVLAELHDAVAARTIQA